MAKIKYITKIDLINITLEALYLNGFEQTSNKLINHFLTQKNKYSSYIFLKSNKLLTNNGNCVKYNLIYTIKILELIYKIMNNHNLYKLIKKIIQQDFNNNTNILKKQYLNKFQYIYYKTYLYYNIKAYSTSYNINQIAMINIYIIYKTIEKNTLFYLLNYLLL